MLLSCAACAAAPALAVTPLGSAADFAVFGTAAVTNTNATTVFGDIGTSPGTSYTGGSSVLHTGSVYLADAVASQARADAQQAYDLFAGLPPGVILTGTDLGAFGALQPGVYTFATAAHLTGSLILDFTGNPGGSFIFRVGTTLTTAAGSAINVLGGNAGSGIFWQVGTAATLGVGSQFAGNILADQSITVNSGAQIMCGRVLALVGIVTMDGNSISSNCRGAGALNSGRSDFGSDGFAGHAFTGSVPEPASWAMMITGFAAIGLVLRRRRLTSAIESRGGTA